MGNICTVTREDAHVCAHPSRYRLYLVVWLPQGSWEKKISYLPSPPRKRGENVVASTSDVCKSVW